MTLEDETGFVNLVVWDKIFQEHTVLIKTTSFIGVTGKVQTQDGVTHVIANSFWSRPRASARRITFRRPGRGCAIAAISIASVGTCTSAR